MDAGRPQTVMTALGFDAESSRLYSRLLPLSGWPIAGVALTIGLTVDDLVTQAAVLTQHGIVRLGETTITVLSPADVFAHMLEEAAAGAQQAHDRLLRISQSVPYVAGSAARIPPADHAKEQPIDGEVISVVEWDPDMFQRLVDTTSGDLDWLRPLNSLDRTEAQWLPVIESAVASGRSCRGIYPLTVLRHSPEMVHRRLDAGEEIRLVPEVPTYLMVIGATHATFPDPLGAVEHPEIIVRQRGIVELASRYFNELWRRAVPVAEFDEGPGIGGGERTLLLEELASGAQDEQIARRLGVSLRTVRRRVADLFTELDASSRFEAGVEAVRRGWL